MLVHADAVFIYAVMDRTVNGGQESESQRRINHITIRLKYDLFL